MAGVKIDRFEKYFFSPFPSYQSQAFINATTACSLRYSADNGREVQFDRWMEC